ncbi:MAG TPA: lysylphosphatidylglycerol synthase transmembrane domain-containing protein [Blastocatellia bacterium]|nr:lysylphosphatidylglycerol synthase transmembrane domain-containing protein [Blastocatellia bacterium]
MHNRLKILAGAVLGVGLIYWFARGLDAAAVWATISRANWWLLALATVLTASTYLIRAIRWQALLEPVRPGIKLSNLFATTALGFAAVFLVGRTGEIVRPVSLSSKEHVRPSASLATILVERIFDMVTVVAFFAVDLLIFKPPLADALTIERIRLSGGILLGIAIGSIFGLVMLYRHRVGAVDFLNRMLHPFGRRIRKGTVNVVSHFAEALSILHDRKELFVVACWSLLLWIVCAVVNSLVFNAFGLHLSLSGAIFVLGFGLVGSLVPTPGGAAGAFHMATAGGLMMLGTGENEAKSIAIVLHLIVFGCALPLGIYYVLRGGYSLSRLRAALSEDLNSIPDFSPNAGYEPGIGAIAPAEELPADR